MYVPDVMNAVYMVGPKQLEIRQIPVPALETDMDVLVRVRAVGVCGSDLTAWKGDHPHVKMPSIPGHEMVGEVVAVGSAVKCVAVGDHVVREPIDYCGYCYACTHGRPNVCADLKVWGFARDGGHREYFVSDASKLFKFDKDIDWTVAAMIEPYTIAAEVNERAEIAPGDVVLIYGLGPAGMSIADWAKFHGATVIACDLIPKRLEMAAEFGFDYVFDSASEDVAARVMEITGGEGANVIIDAAGAPGILDHALELLSPAGRIVPVAFNFSPSPISYGEINIKEAKIVGSRLESGKFPVVIDELKAHSDHIRRQITHIFPMAEVDRAFETAASRDPMVGKVVVTYGGDI